MRVRWRAVEQPLHIGDCGGEDGADVDSTEELGRAGMVEIPDLEAELGLFEGLTVPSLLVPVFVLGV